MQINNTKMQHLI